MTNWCDFVFECDDVRVLAVNQRLERLRGDDLNNADRVLHSQGTDDEGRKDWLLTREGFQRQPSGKVALVGETKWGPPKMVLDEISAEFPDTTFELRYGVDSLWDSAIYHVKNRGWELIERQVGWFRSMRRPYSAPVHHHVIRFADADVATQVRVRELAEAKVIFRCETTEYHADSWACRCDPRDLGTRLDGEPLAYTLDEMIYLDSMHSRARETERRAVALCGCGIQLTDEEKRWVAANDLVAIPDDVPLEKHPEYWDRTLAHARHELGIYTTRYDLRLLLTKPDLTAARYGEIEAAMRTPGWTREWPEWADIMRRPQAPVDATTGEQDFLAELKKIGGMPESG
jgi:hypothetical protein